MKLIQLYKERQCPMIRLGYLVFAGKQHVFYFHLNTHWNRNYLSVVHTHIIICDELLWVNFYLFFSFFWKKAHSKNEKLDSAYQEVT